MFKSTELSELTYPVITSPLESICIGPCGPIYDVLKAIGVIYLPRSPLARSRRASLIGFVVLYIVLLNPRAIIIIQEYASLYNRLLIQLMMILYV